MSDKKKKKKELSMAELTAGYDVFMKDKILDEKGKEKFEKAVKKASTPSVVK